MSKPSLHDLFVGWRLLERELFQAAEKVVLPWICVDDEHIEALERIELGSRGPSLRRIELSDLEEGVVEPGGCVLLLFGSSEAGAEAIRLIRAIRGREIAIYPLVLLGDDYFRVPEGEVFHYSQPLSLLRVQCGPRPVVAFRLPRDFTPLSPRVTGYFQALGALMVLLRVRDCEQRLRTWEAGLEGACGAVRALATRKGGRSALLAVFLARLEEVHGTLAMYLDVSPGGEQAALAAIEAVQQENQGEAVAERFPTLGSSRLAAELVGTEVLDLSRMIDTFLSDCRAREDLSWLREELAGISLASTLSTMVTFVGPFSSGKTTLLNQLLWGSGRLRTSKGHNTAILCEICYDESEVPLLELIWKQDVRLELLYPSNDSDVAVESPVSGRVVEIHRSSIHNIVWIEDQWGRRHHVSLGTRVPSVRSCDGVRQGQLLSEGLPPKRRRGIRWYSGVGRREINTLLKMLRSHNLEEARVELVGLDGNVELVHPQSVLQQLLPAVEETYNSSLDGRALEWALGRPVLSLSLTGHLHPRHRLTTGFNLDDQGWKRFQGEEGGEAFAEDPLCYLFLERARIHLRHDFLRLASLVDTPGLGSVTDRHDEITESFLLRGSGLIVLFVRMDHQWQREGFWRLLHLIASLPEERTRGNVIVLCNWWRSISRQRIEKDLAKLRAFLGERFPDVFVFDLQKLLEEGSASARVGDFGTFEEMRDLLRWRVNEEGAGKGLRTIQIRVGSILRQRSANLETQLASLLTGEEERRALVNRLEECLRGIPVKEVSASMAPLEEKIRSYRPLVAKLDNKESWRTYRDALIETARTINAAAADDPFGDLLAQVSETHRNLRRLSLRLSIPDLPAPPQGGVPVHGLTEKIDTILRDWPWLTLPIGKYRGQRREEMETWFDGHIRELEKDLTSYRYDCESRVNNFNKTARTLVTNALAAARGGRDGKDEELRKELAQLQREILPRWQKISGDIDRVLERG